MSTELSLVKWGYSWCLGFSGHSRAGGQAGCSLLCHGHGAPNHQFGSRSRVKQERREMLKALQIELHIGIIMAAILRSCLMMLNWWQPQIITVPPPHSWGFFFPHHPPYQLWYVCNFPSLCYQLPFSKGSRESWESPCMRGKEKASPLVLVPLVCTYRGVYECGQEQRPHSLQ